MNIHSLANRFVSILRAATREPLFQFLALGLALFLLYGWVNDDRRTEDQAHILVDRANLLEFMQMRAQQFDNDAEGQLMAMPSAEVAALASQYVQEEAKYREAVELGLGENDYLIRRRLVQSFEFFIRSLGEGAEPSPAQLQAFYRDHQQRYAAPSLITFTHIFFSEELHGRDGAGRRAARALASLNGGGGQASIGESWPGDRFAYNLNYADRDEVMIASHFGKDMARKLFSAEAGGDLWQGPYRSGSGIHLVRIERLTPGTVMAFDQVKEDVARDFIEAGKEALEGAATAELVKTYDVTISPDLRELMAESNIGE